MRTQIKNTDVFKGLNKMRQQITRSRNNIKHITSGYLIAKNIGFKDFEKFYGYSFINKKIIKELLDEG